MTLFGDSDISFCDSIASELNSIQGTLVTYYKMKHAEVQVNMYGEPEGDNREQDQVDFEFNREVMGFVDYPESTPMVNRDGQSVHFDSQLWIARKDFEETFPENPERTDVVGRYQEPRLGDVVGIQGTFYSVTDIDLDGQLADSIGIHTMWILKLKYRSEFEQSRRIDV